MRIALGSFFAALIMLFAIQAHSAAPATRPASKLYDELVSKYLDGKWDDLQADLASRSKEIAQLPQRADIAYIRQSIAECRPPWWKLAKAGNKFDFRPSVWGRSVMATFDPSGSGVQMSHTPAGWVITVSWSPAEMDNPEHAEHGFSKGELNNLGVWMNLGMAESWSSIPLSAQANLSEPAKLLLSRYLNFRSNVSGAYYGYPRARRWGLWLCLAAHMDKYAKMEIVNSRKAEAAWFIAELLSNPAKYPSIKIPASIPAEGAEGKLALSLKDWIEKRPWTLAEDKSIRESLRSFAIANQGSVLQTGNVKLPSGLLIALDPALDEQHRPKRDAWVKAKLK